MRQKGIHDAIKAWEYMNKFYVEEGNKRVSVMKYFGADSIQSGDIVLPKRTNDKKIKSILSFLIFIRYPVSIISGSRRKLFGTA